MQSAFVKVIIFHYVFVLKGVFYFAFLGLLLIYFT
jgi:hypothetical protein